MIMSDDCDEEINMKALLNGNDKVVKVMFGVSFMCHFVVIKRTKKISKIISSRLMLNN